MSEAAEIPQKTPRSIARNLRVLRRKIFQWFFVDGANRILLALLALCVVSFGIDRLARMDRPQRGVMLVIGLGLLAWIAWKKLIRPLFSKLSDDALVLEVEKQTPEAKEELITEMYSRKVIIVTPTTLLATLRTVEYFWQLEKQNRNALEIAERAGGLYDKLRGFLEDMERLGRQLDTCKDSYDKAINKLSQGRGNLLSQASKFPDLGVKVKAEFPKSLLHDTSNETCSN